MGAIVIAACASGGIAASRQASRAFDPAADPIVTGAVSSPRTDLKAPYPGRHGPLTPREREIAQIAWRYFVNNTQASTGLVNAVNDYPSTTLWDAGSSIAAVISAQGLGLIPAAEAEARLGRMVDALGRLELFRDLCPNKVYNSATGAKVDYANRPGEIGCSALDVGRLLLWMRVIQQRHPALAPRVEKTVAHLNVGSMVRDGELVGTAVEKDGTTVFLQEGRLGYEEYGAKGFQLWGYDTRKASRPQPYATLSIHGVRVPYDSRDPRVLGAHNYVVTESYALDAIEYGWDEVDDTRSGPFEHSSGWTAAAAQRIYLAQQRRFERTGILTARTEHQLAGEPYFVYDTIFSDGQPWATITDTGKSVPQFAAVALKGAFSLWVLWNTPYTDRLFAAVSRAYDPKRGFYEGVLEAGGNIEAFTANNNGIILENLLYKVQGKIYRSEPRRRAPAKARGIDTTSQTAALPPASDDAAAATDPIVRGAVRSPRTDPQAPHPGRHGALTSQERAMALAAWRYFENNTQASTGLVNAVHGYPSTTMWDTAAAVSAVVAAERLGIIGRPDAEARLGKAIATLGRIRRFRDLCPNKVYNTADATPADYSNKPAEIGCSALDVGRLLTWMHIVRTRFPTLRERVEASVAHWNIKSMIREGEMFGTAVQDGKTVFLQEGRLGYEEYAAKGFALWGLDAAKASAPAPYATTKIMGVSIAHDRRDARSSGGHNYVVTESYALDGIEFGWDEASDASTDAFEHSQGWMARAARNVYLVQERRFRDTGTLTARTEHQLAAPPYFVYDTVFSDGQPWATITDTGRAVPEGSAIAAKAALGLWVLFPTAYTDKLFDSMTRAYDPKLGFYEGVLESGGNIRAFTANNNGIILATLAYKVAGPLVRLRAP
jgi:hypothetical protein